MCSSDLTESISAPSGNGEGFYEYKTADNKYYYALRLSDNVKKIWLAGPFSQNKKLTAVSTGYPPAPSVYEDKEGVDRTHPPPASRYPIIPQDFAESLLAKPCIKIEDIQSILRENIWWQSVNTDNFATYGFTFTFSDFQYIPIIPNTMPTYGSTAYNNLKNNTYNFAVLFLKKRQNTGDKFMWGKIEAFRYGNIYYTKNDTKGASFTKDSIMTKATEPEILYDKKPTLPTATPNGDKWNLNIFHPVGLLQSEQQNQNTLLYLFKNLNSGRIYWRIKPHDNQNFMKQTGDGAYSGLNSDWTPQWKRLTGNEILKRLEKGFFHINRNQEFKSISGANNKSDIIIRKNADLFYESEYESINLGPNYITLESANLINKEGITSDYVAWNIGPIDYFVIRKPELYMGNPSLATLARNKKEITIPEFEDYDTPFPVQDTLPVKSFLQSETFMLDNVYVVQDDGSFKQGKIGRAHV